MTASTIKNPPNVCVLESRCAIDVPPQLLGKGYKASLQASKFKGAAGSKDKSNWESNILIVSSPFLLSSFTI